jgi:hypothetical protein
VLVLAADRSAKADLPQPGDIAFGLSVSDAATSLELVRGNPEESGGAALTSPWTMDGFIQSMAFDNLNGVMHNARGNLLGLNFGATATGGQIYSFATQVDPAPAGQLIGDTMGLGGEGLDISRLNGLSVSPDNSKVAVTARDTGRLVLYDYTPGDTMGAGAELSNARQSNQLWDSGQTEGSIWLDDDTVLVASAFSPSNLNLHTVDATTLTSNVVANPAVTVGGSNFTSLAYNPDVSPLLFVSYSSFAGSTANALFIFDTEDNFSLVNQIDYTNSSQTGREIALDADGNLFIGAYGGSDDPGAKIGLIPDAVANAATLTDDPVIPWYVSTTESSFNGLDIGFGEAVIEGLPGDYNDDGVVNAADYIAWRNNEGQNVTLPGERTDAATPGVPDMEDYTFWVSQFGQGLETGSGSTVVPEPASLAMLLLAVAGLVCRGTRGRRSVSV